MANLQGPSFPWPLLRFWIRDVLPVWLGLAAGVFLIQIAISGIIHDNERIKVLLQMIDMWPSFLKAMFGGEWLKSGDISAFVAIGYQHPLVLLLYMLYAVGVPSALLAGESEQGGMELILSRWVTKTQVYVCTAIVTLVGMACLVSVTFLGTATATSLYDFGQDVPLFRFFQITVSSAMLSSAVGAITLLAAASFRSRKRAVTATVVFLVANYFVSVISEMWPRMAFLYPYTLFNYSGGEAIFARGQWPWQDMAICAAVLIDAVIAGAVIWQRRDLRC